PRWTHGLTNIANARLRQSNARDRPKIALSRKRTTRSPPIGSRLPSKWNGWKGEVLSGSLGKQLGKPPKQKSPARAGLNDNGIVGAVKPPLSLFADDGS